MQPKHATKPSRRAPLLAFAVLVLLAGVALAVLKPGDLDDSKSNVSRPAPAKTTTTTTTKPSSTSTTAAPANTATTARGSQATTSTTAAAGGSTTTTRSSTATTSTTAPSSTSPPTTAKPTTTTRSGTGTGGNQMANTGGRSLILPGMAALALALVVRRLALH